MNIENLNCYDICDYIRENNIGETDMLKIIKKYTESYDIDLLKRLQHDISFYLFKETEEYEAKFTLEDVLNAIDEREKNGLKIPYIHPTPYEKLTEKGKAHRDKMKTQGYEPKPCIDMEALLFPYEFYNVRRFEKLVVEKIRKLYPELKNSNSQSFSVMLPEKYSQKLEPAPVVSDIEPQPQNIKPLQWQGSAIQLTELTEALINCNMLNPELNKEQIYERVKQLFNFDFDHKEHKKTIRKRTKNLTPFIEILDTSLKNWITQKDGN